MAREKTPDLMDEFLGSKKPHISTTSAPQTTHGKTTKRSALTKYHIRLHDEDWKALQEHFEAQGISVSAGIRMVLVQYMRSKGIR